MTKIYVILEGGLCQGVFTDDPRFEGVEFCVVDYDTEGADETSEIDQGDGSVQDAVVWGDKIGKAVIEICAPGKSE